MRILIIGGGRFLGRAFAAEALAGTASALDAIMNAAANDPALFATAARATQRSRPTAEGYLAVERLPAPSPEAQRDGLLAIAAELPAADLLRVASRPTFCSAGRVYRCRSHRCR